MSTKILVSVCCITYNHASYIRQCLEGFLMQKTTFPFEIIINDDCSTDGTTEIIKEYADKYPDLFVPIFHEENQYQKGVRGIYAKFVYPKVRGKYIALCEGDDYWIDPLKLQKQVDFLEGHPDCSLCFHKSKVISLVAKGMDLYGHLRQGYYSAEQILKKWTIPTASVLCLSKYLPYIPNDKRFMYGDIVLFLTMATHGRVYCLGEEMSIYRRLSSGAIYSQQKSTSLYKRSIYHYIALAQHFPTLRKQTCLQIIKLCAFYCRWRLKSLFGYYRNSI